MDDQKIVAELRSGINKRYLSKLYDYLPVVEKSILKNGGSKSDALDVFQDALILFCEKVREVDFELKSSINTYLYGVCRNLWLNELRKRNKSISLDWEVERGDFSEEDLTAQLEESERISKVENAILQLGQRCQKLLHLFYFERLKMVDIAKKMGLNSANVAKVQKHKCLNKVKQLVKVTQ
ncbi:MAG: sigma-70 family RNA polymerase sigma factor [Flavobacteriia bacterium]|nr:sigma-70 family RNA polymerase sigma factor [Flavobacteriia bacterium]